MMGITVLAADGMPEVEQGADLPAMIAASAELRDGDVVVVAQKVVSKAEGRVRRLSDVEPGPQAQRIAEQLDRDPRLVQVVLDESVRVVRERGALIVETRHGFVCANAGVDQSNVPGTDCVTLLPEDCDRSAAGIREGLRALTGKEVAVIVADTFGRAWRTGIVNVALGVAGMAALVDHRGRPDDYGREMHATVLAVADELAAAAELTMGKTRRVPVALIRGYVDEGPPGSGRDLLRDAEHDLFR